MARAQPPVRQISGLVYGCHGGAGTTTIAALVGASGDLGQRPPDRWMPIPLLLVARTTATGTARLVRAAASARELGYDSIVVAVGDGPWPAPVAARARLRMLSRSGSTVLCFPYVAHWRCVDDVIAHACQAGLPIAAYRAAARIRIAMLKHHQALQQDRTASGDNSPDTRREKAEVA